jgi:D-alanine-D-alanine ligase
MPEARDLVVIYGGPSAEHEVSCVSALRIAATARRDGKHVTAIGLTHDKRWVDANDALAGLDEIDALPSPDDLLRDAPVSELFDLASGLPEHAVVFPLLHGPFGEDGVIQGHFEAIGVPYVGAGVLSSAICMDKGIAKSVLHDHGLPVAPWRLLRRSQGTDEVMEEAAHAFGFPIFVKPANLGSSIGVTKVRALSELRSAVESAFEFDDYVILEEFVNGRELELALLGNESVRVSQAGEIEASRDFYDYEDKYELGLAKTIVPTDLTAAQLAQAQELATNAFRALRVEGLARIDLFLVGPSTFVINEVNTMPGFTPISMYPMLWEAEGLPLRSLIDELITLAVARHHRRNGLRTNRLR